MTQSIIIYSIVMIIMILCGIYASHRNGNFNHSIITNKGKINFWRIEIVIPIILFTTIFAMRYDVGTDYLHYLGGYLNGYHVGKNEWLFESLSIFAWNYNFHFSIYFGLIVFIQIFLFYYAFRYEQYLYPFLIFFLFTNGEWLSWMNILRQSLALCIWIFSLNYIENKKPLHYIFLCLLAFLCHNSAIILVIFYPILKNGKDYFGNIFLQLILLLSALLTKQYFSGFMQNIAPIIESYTTYIGGGAYTGYSVDKLEESFIESEGTGLAYIFKLFLNIVIILYSNRLKLFYNNKRFVIIYSLFVISLITFYMFPIGLVSITRPFRYFYIFQSIIFAYFLYYLYKNRTLNSDLGKINTLIYYGVIIIFLLIFYLSLITSNEDGHMWYQFYFQHNIYGYPI